MTPYLASEESKAFDKDSMVLIRKSKKKLIKIIKILRLKAVDLEDISLN